MSPPDIELIGVEKRFGDVVAVESASLVVERGEFISILGPSGCGKSTTLAMIVGFQEPTAGTIRIRSVDQAGVPPERRNIGMVFQNYALFPHMTVAENVAFGLRMRGADAVAIATTVARVVKMVHLEGFEDRYPRALSGGQQQRAALARAIAPQSSVLLLDEPLSNLDQKLREAMRLELKQLHRALGMTFVYVTHDQEEALAMSDRIVVMSRGRIAQVGTPADIYQRPADAFVADFIGKSSILEVDSGTAENGLSRLRIAGTDCHVLAKAERPQDGRRITRICIRPEKIAVRGVGEAKPEGCNTFDAVIADIVNLGSHLQLILRIAADRTVIATVSSERLASLRPMQAVSLHVMPEHIIVLSE
jgi:putative spermidine/putrescine transport system ATP-binding protein/spermidine/putrescine transport system ATP-binding protein